MASSEENDIVLMNEPCHVSDYVIPSMEAQYFAETNMGPMTESRHKSEYVIPSVETQRFSENIITETKETIVSVEVSSPPRKRKLPTLRHLSSTTGPTEIPSQVYYSRLHPAVHSRKGNDRSVVSNYQSDVDVVSSKPKVPKITDLQITVSNPSEIKTARTELTDIKDDSQKSFSRNHIKQICPYPECRRLDIKLKRHIMRYHLPQFFEEEMDEDFVPLRLDSLRSLSRVLMGREDFSELVNIVNCSRHIPKSSTIHSVLEKCMKELCLYAGWQIPVNFTLHPVNSPAMLLHFRCVTALLLQLTLEQPKIFKLTGLVSSKSQAQKSTKQPAVYYNNSTVPRREPMSSPRFDIKSATGSRNSSVPREESAFDSHFHLNRTSQRIWGTVAGKYPQDFIKYALSENIPSHKVNVIGGVLNYSEPSNYKNIPIPSGNWKIAVGVHPKRVSELTEDRFQQLQQLMKCSTIAALGEVGLDRTVPFQEWRIQEAALTRILKLAVPEKCLVLHLRGSITDRYSIDVSARCLRILDNTISHRQRIHLHCFAGDSDQVSERLKAYPHTYFGFTGLAKTFDTTQIEALKSVPLDKLLIETDSPYLSVHSGINTPAHIGEVASVVAGQLGRCCLFP